MAFASSMCNVLNQQLKTSIMWIANAIIAPLALLKLIERYVAQTEDEVIATATESVDNMCQGIEDAVDSLPIFDVQDPGFVDALKNCPYFSSGDIENVQAIVDKIENNPLATMADMPDQMVGELTDVVKEGFAEGLDSLSEQLPSAQIDLLKRKYEDMLKKAGIIDTMKHLYQIQQCLEAGCEAITLSENYYTKYKEKLRINDDGELQIFDKTKNTVSETGKEMSDSVKDKVKNTGDRISQAKDKINNISIWG